MNIAISNIISKIKTSLIKNKKIHFKPTKYHKFSKRKIENFIKSYGIKIYIYKITYNSAYNGLYSSDRDQIGIHNAKKFETINQFYNTLFHEISHSTGHKKRLNRSAIVVGCYSESCVKYAKEELLAEFSSILLCHHFKLHKKTINDQVSYLKLYARIIKMKTTKKRLTYSQILDPIIKKALIIEKYLSKYYEL